MAERTPFTLPERLVLISRAKDIIKDNIQLTQNVLAVDPSTVNDSVDRVALRAQQMLAEPRMASFDRYASLALDRLSVRGSAVQRAISEASRLDDPALKASMQKISRMRRLRLVTGSEEELERLETDYRSLGNSPSIEVTREPATIVTLTSDEINPKTGYRTTLAVLGVLKPGDPGRAEKLHPAAKEPESSTSEQPKPDVTEKSYGVVLENGTEVTGNLGRFLKLLASLNPGEVLSCGEAANRLGLKRVQVTRLNYKAKAKFDELGIDIPYSESHDDMYRLSFIGSGAQVRIIELPATTAKPAKPKASPQLDRDGMLAKFKGDQAIFSDGTIVGGRVVRFLDVLDQLPIDQEISTAQIVADLNFTPDDVNRAKYDANILFAKLAIPYRVDAVIPVRGGRASYKLTSLKPAVVPEPVAAEPAVRPPAPAEPEQQKPTGLTEEPATAFEPEPPIPTVITDSDEATRQSPIPAVQTDKNRYTYRSGKTISGQGARVLHAVEDAESRGERLTTRQIAEITGLDLAAVGPAIQAANFTLTQQTGRIIRSNHVTGKNAVPGTYGFVPVDQLEVEPATNTGKKKFSQPLPPRWKRP